MSLPKSAMVLAAGRGTRLMPHTQNRPKAMVKVGGRTLIDHQLDCLAKAGVKRAVVNVHHFADDLEAHLVARLGGPKIQFSSERDQLLETGGALVRARSSLGEAPFFVMNCDALWSKTGAEPLQTLCNAWANHDAPAAILLLAQKQRSLGLDTRGDFAMDAQGRLRRPKAGEQVPYYYAGTQILSPALLDGEEERPFSANLLWDKAMQSGALYGVMLDGFWLHVGDPQALQDANAHLKAHP
jgi:N-acetyl-alpha-D-muramate 1-phosphate uridylyltransferase